MSSYQIHAIATRALLDPEFRKAILNGQRRQKLQEFDLPSELVDVILSIEGNDIHQFIFGLNNLATSKQDQTTPREWKTMPVQMHCSHEQEEVRPANSQRNQSRGRRGPQDRGGNPNAPAGRMQAG